MTPFHQDDACMHRTPLGRECRTCGGVVGGSGPARIEPRQIWRARSWPFGKVAVVGLDSGVVHYMQREGVLTMDVSDFCDEFWFWGAPSPERSAFDAKLEPLAERFTQARRREDVLAAYALIQRLLDETERAMGARPKLELRGQIVTIEWPDENALRRAIGGSR